MSEQDSTPDTAVVDVEVDAVVEGGVVEETPKVTAAATPQAVPVASDHPDRWGRVDADGTVYVTTADGERAVGSWQAGEPVEGLAHFARRFDDLRTEVELLVTRLKSGAGDPKHALTSAKHVQGTARGRRRRR